MFGICVNSDLEDVTSIHTEGSALLTGSHVNFRHPWTYLQQGFPALQ